MATIDKDEIEKYIFDPDNPKACKSYKLLLNIVKKETYSYFSPDFVHYLFSEQIINNKFETQLWDKPKNYNQLNSLEKLDIYQKNFSREELNDYINNLELKLDKILKNKIFKYFFNLEYTHQPHNKLINQVMFIYIENKIEHEMKDFIKDSIVETDSNLEEKFHTLPFSNKDVNNHCIIFTKNFYSILKLSIIRSSICITLKENIDNFLELNENPNIKPLFLKKIEDVDLLLNVLENDLKGKESQKIEEKEIATIDSVHIQNFFSIKNIELNNLRDKKEIYIVGENGDGKTLLLQAITIALAGVKEGDVFDLVKSQQEYSLVVWDTQKNEYNQNAEDAYEYILAYGASRNNYCQLKEDHTGYLSLFTSEYDLKNPIEWLQYLDYREKDEKRNIISVTRAKELLNHLLNTDISIDITPDRVSFSEKGSVVSFEQLSAGYKGVITIVCDMIARFSQNQQVENISQFQGVVLI
ncbi:MAG: AAA family ATPase, partial [Campylobacterota bacterium]|nr:AAA family ATPase [Campylobacterota bacterium]